MLFSIIIPLYNRPDEIKELLESMTVQSYFETAEGADNYEIVIVEDGSSISSEQIINEFNERLNIKYFTKENGGPASARNYAAERAEGEWLIFLDSDTVIPEGWLVAISKNISTVDAFGGADRASDDFSPVQKAINYSMTSFFTTGGIRGSKKSVEKFHPRSFNMGIKKCLYEKLGGFSADMRFGEDIDLSIRIFESGARCVFIEDAWVYHKRRVDFKKFYRQVRASGGARIALTKKHKGTLKLVHLLPFGFTVFVFMTLIATPICHWAALPLAAWAALITIDATIRLGGVEMGFLALYSSFIQLIGYGIGFLKALCGMNKNLDKKFYK